MGLLDDAIREHLELKRRRGADPDEIARQEREALSPVARRGDTPAAGEGEASESAPAPGDTEAPHTEEADPRGGSEAPPAEDLFLGDDGGEAPAEDVLPRGEADAPPDAHDAPARAGDDWLEEADGDEPEPLPGLSDETVEYRIPEAEDELAAGGEPQRAHAAEEEPATADGEDPLEETPDFLQETPEHDRLWFEQKPPRDFDFGG